PISGALRILPRAHRPVDAIRALSEHVARVSYRDLPPAAIAAAKTFLQDTIGVGVAGSAGTWANGLLDCLDVWGTGHEASVFARGGLFPAPSGALANAYQIPNSGLHCVPQGALRPTKTAAGPGAVADAGAPGW